MISEVPSITQKPNNSHDVPRKKKQKADEGVAATKTQTDTNTSTTYTGGTVTTYEPGKTVVVKSDQGPVSFALGTAARVVDGAGKVVTAPLRSGQKVRVYYTGPAESRTVERVIVED